MWLVPTRGTGRGCRLSPCCRVACRVVSCRVVRVEAHGRTATRSLQLFNCSVVSSHEILDPAFNDSANSNSTFRIPSGSGAVRPTRLRKPP